MRILAIVPVLALVAACSFGSSGSDADPDPVEATSITVARGMPEWAGTQTNGMSGAGVDADGNLVVVTFGSSSNPDAAVAATLADTTVTVDAQNEKDRPSTMDLVPTTSTITFPDGLPRDTEITVDLGRFGKVTIPTTAQSFDWVPAPAE